MFVTCISPTCIFARDTNILLHQNESFRAQLILSSQVTMLCCFLLSDRGVGVHALCRDQGPGFITGTGAHLAQGRTVMVSVHSLTSAYL